MKPATQAKATRAIADRRKEERHPPEVEPTLVWVSVDRRHRGTLVDQSVEGIGAVVDCEDISQFEIGFQVMVELLGKKHLAEIVNVAEASPGKCRLGLRWENPQMRGGGEGERLGEVDSHMDEEQWQQVSEDITSLSLALETFGDNTPQQQEMLIEIMLRCSQRLSIHLEDLVSSSSRA